MHYPILRTKIFYKWLKEKWDAWELRVGLLCGCTRVFLIRLKLFLFIRFSVSIVASAVRRIILKLTVLLNVTIGSNVHIKSFVGVITMKRGWSHQGPPRRRSVWSVHFKAKPYSLFPKHGLALSLPLRKLFTQLSQLATQTLCLLSKTIDFPHQSKEYACYESFPFEPLIVAYGCQPYLL